MDLSKAHVCLPLILLIAKLGAYCLYKTSLRLLMDYLNSGIQPTKLDYPTGGWSEIKRGISQGSILGPLLV